MNVKIRSIITLFLLSIAVILAHGCISHNEGINDLLTGAQDIEISAIFNKIDDFLNKKKYSDAMSELNNVDTGKLDSDSVKKINSYYAWVYYNTETPSKTLDYLEKNEVDEFGQMVEFFCYWSRRYNGDISKAISIAESMGFSSASSDYSNLSKYGISAGEIHAMTAFCYYLRGTGTDYTTARNHIDRSKQLNLVENSYATSQIIDALDNLIP